MNKRKMQKMMKEILEQKLAAQETKAFKLADLEMLAVEEDTAKMSGLDVDGDLVIGEITNNNSNIF